jgi:hypothetical protein
MGMFVNSAIEASVVAQKDVCLQFLRARRTRRSRSPLHMKSFFDYQFVKATDKKSAYDLEFTQ